MCWKNKCLQTEKETRLVHIINSAQWDWKHLLLSTVFALSAWILSIFFASYDHFLFQMSENNNLHLIHFHFHHFQSQEDCIMLHDFIICNWHRFLQSALKWSDTSEKIKDHLIMHIVYKSWKQFVHETESKQCWCMKIYASSSDSKKSFLIQNQHLVQNEQEVHV